MQIAAQEYKTANRESGPYGITARQDGTIWFTEQKGNRIGRLTKDGDMRTFEVPTPDAGVMSILCPYR